MQLKGGTRVASPIILTYRRECRPSHPLSSHLDMLLNSVTIYSGYKNKYKNWREHQINNCILNFQVFQVEYIKISQNYATGVHREKSTTGYFFHEQLVKLEEYENACYIPTKA